MLRAYVTLLGALGLYCLAAACGVAGRPEANDHPTRRGQVGPGWY